MSLYCLILGEREQEATTRKTRRKKNVKENPKKSRMIHFRYQNDNSNKISKRILIIYWRSIQRYDFCNQEKIEGNFDKYNRPGECFGREYI